MTATITTTTTDVKEPETPQQVVVDHCDHQQRPDQGHLHTDNSKHVQEDERDRNNVNLTIKSEGVSHVEDPTTAVSQDQMDQEISDNVSHSRSHNPANYKHIQSASHQHHHHQHQHQRQSENSRNIISWLSSTPPFASRSQGAADADQSSSTFGRTQAGYHHSHPPPPPPPPQHYPGDGHRISSDREYYNPDYRTYHSQQPPEYYERRIPYPPSAAYHRPPSFQPQYHHSHPPPPSAIGYHSEFNRSDDPYVHYPEPYPPRPPPPPSSAQYHPHTGAPSPIPSVSVASSTSHFPQYNRYHPVQPPPPTPQYWSAYPRNEYRPPTEPHFSQRQYPHHQPPPPHQYTIFEQPSHSAEYHNSPLPPTHHRQQLPVPLQNEVYPPTRSINQRHSSPTLPNHPLSNDDAKEPLHETRDITSAGNVGTPPPPSSPPSVQTESKVGNDAIHDAQLDTKTVADISMTIASSVASHADPATTASNKDHTRTSTAVLTDNQRVTRRSARTSAANTPVTAPRPAIARGSAQSLKRLRSSVPRTSNMNRDISEYDDVGNSSVAADDSKAPTDACTSHVKSSNVNEDTVASTTSHRTTPRAKHATASTSSTTRRGVAKTARRSRSSSRSKDVDGSQDLPIHDGSVNKSLYVRGATVKIDRDQVLTMDNASADIHTAASDRHDTISHDRVSAVMGGTSDARRVPPPIQSPPSPPHHHASKMIKLGQGGQVAEDDALSEDDDDDAEAVLNDASSVASYDSTNRASTTASLSTTATLRERKRLQNQAACRRLRSKRAAAKQVLVDDLNALREENMRLKEVELFNRAERRAREMMEMQYKRRISELENDLVSLNRY